DRGLAKIDEYEERLKHELNVIQGKDFSSYFIIVGNMIRWAKRQGIQVGFARGSAAGSLVCYVLGITEVDPIKWGTICERFIDPSRADFPDIDVDIADDRRDEVKEYLAKQYGYTANITTVTTYKEKNSVKDAASILQINFAETNKALETVESFDDYLSQPASREFHKKYPDVLKVAK